MLRPGRSLQLGAGTANTSHTILGQGLHPQIQPRRQRSVVIAAAPAPASTAVDEVPSDVKKVLFTADQVQQRVQELGRVIGQEYAGKKLLVLGVLNGAWMFTADLVRCIEPTNNLRVDFIKASSYGAGTESAGTVAIRTLGEVSSWGDYHVLLVEDIVDSGHTLQRLAQELRHAGAQSVKVVAFLDKKGRRQVELFPDYVGYECPNDFVVGYGLDWDERYRWLPYIAALKESAYSGH